MCEGEELRESRGNRISLLALRPKALQSTDHQGFRYREPSIRVLEREGGEGYWIRDGDVERNIRVTLHQRPRLPVSTAWEYGPVFRTGLSNPLKEQPPESDEPGSCSGSIVSWAGWLQLLRY